MKKKIDVRKLVKHIKTYRPEMKKKIDYYLCSKCGQKSGYWVDDKTYIEIPHKCKKEIEKSCERNKRECILGGKGVCRATSNYYKECIYKLLNPKSQPESNPIIVYYCPIIKKYSDYKCPISEKIKKNCRKYKSVNTSDCNKEFILMKTNVL